TEPRPLAAPQRAPHIARPDGGGQPVGRAIAPGDRLRLIAEALDGDHRTEDLALDQLVFLVQARDDRRLQEEAGSVRLASAGHQLGALRAPLGPAFPALPPPR